MKRFFRNISPYFLFFILISASINIISIKEEPAEIERDIETKEQEKSDLTKQLEKAQKDIDNYKKSKELLEKKAASKDPKITDIQRENAAQKALEYEKMIGDRQTTINRIKNDQLPVLEKEIKSLQEQLTTELQIREQKPDTYQKFLADTIGSLPATKQSGALLKQFSDIAKQYPDYNDQIKMLQELNDFIQKSDASVKGEVLETVQIRLKALKDALANKPPANPTGIERDNNLWNKIPSDQIQILQTIADKTEKAINQELANPVSKDQLGTLRALKELGELNQIYITIDHQNLRGSDQLPQVQTAANNLYEKAKQLEQKIVKQAIDELTTQVQAITLVFANSTDAEAINAGRDLLPQINKKINELSKQISFLGIENKDIAEAINNIKELFSTIKPPVPVEAVVSPEVRQQLKDPEIDKIVGEIMTKEIVLEQEVSKPNFLTKLKQFVSLKVTQIKEAIATKLENVAETLITKFSKIKDIGIMTKEYASLLQDNQFTIRFLATGIDTVERNEFFTAAFAKLSGVIDTSRIQAFIDAIQQVKPALDFISDQKIAAEYMAKFLKKGAGVLIGIGEAGAWLGKQIAPPSGRSRIQTLAEVKEIESMILQERINIYKKPLSMVEAFSKFSLQPTEKKVDDFKTAVSKAMNNALSSAKDYLINLNYWWKGQDPQNKYQNLTERLSSAQQNFTANATPENAKQVVEVLTEFSSEYEKLYGKNDIAAESLAFLVKAWDGYTFEEQVAVKDLVKSFFDLRALKMSYLQTMRENIDALNAELKQFDNPTVNAIAQNYVTRLQNIISNQMLADIGETAKVLDDLSKQLNETKAKLSGN